MSNVVREPIITTVVVDAIERVVVTEEHARVVSVGTQGPAGPQGPAAVLALPPGTEGAVLFNQASMPGVDATHFRYDTGTQSLYVTTITNAILDGGNF